VHTAYARTHGLVDALNRLAATLDTPTLTDLGYENAADVIRRYIRRYREGANNSRTAL
jgi:hypothetical protein